jgi:hypothetical protein
MQTLETQYHYATGFLGIMLCTNGVTRIDRLHFIFIIIHQPDIFNITIIIKGTYHTIACEIVGTALQKQSHLFIFRISHKMFYKWFYFSLKGPSIINVKLT